MSWAEHIRLYSQPLFPTTMTGQAIESISLEFHCDGSDMARFTDRVMKPMLRALELDEIESATQLTLF